MLLVFIYLPNAMLMLNSRWQRQCRYQSPFRFAIHFSHQPKSLIFEVIHQWLIYKLFPFGIFDVCSACCRYFFFYSPLTPLLHHVVSYNFESVLFYIWMTSVRWYTIGTMPSCGYTIATTFLLSAVVMCHLSPYVFTSILTHWRNQRAIFFNYEYFWFMCFIYYR